MSAPTETETLEQTLRRMRTACAAIKQDMESDVAWFEGKPLDGRNVSVMFGNVAAAVSALAGMIDKLCESSLS